MGEIARRFCLADDLINVYLSIRFHVVSDMPLNQTGVEYREYE